MSGEGQPTQPRGVLARSSWGRGSAKASEPVARPYAPSDPGQQFLLAALEHGAPNHIDTAAALAELISGGAVDCADFDGVSADELAVIWSTFAEWHGENRALFLQACAWPQHRVVRRTLPWSASAASSLSPPRPPPTQIKLTRTSFLQYWRRWLTPGSQAWCQHRRDLLIGCVCWPRVPSLLRCS